MESFRRAPVNYDWCSCKTGNLETGTQEEHHVKMKTEPQAKKHQRLPGNTRSRERGLEQAVPPRPREKPALLTPSPQTSGLQNRDDKSLSLTACGTLSQQSWQMDWSDSGTLSPSLPNSTTGGPSHLRGPQSRAWLAWPLPAYPQISHLYM